MHEIVHDGIASTVHLILAKDNEHDDRSTVVAVKTASAVREYAPEPHDILKEARLITSLSCENVSNTRLIYH
jgi:hypothetical protein